jgi:hypothetical protein
MKSQLKWLQQELRLCWEHRKKVALLYYDQIVTHDKFSIYIEFAGSNVTALG